jgi:phage shock protein PspC (stress-responsive transcriptional regulator)
MNEVTQIHLGRQAFTIAADAHASLRSYLKAIEKAVDDADVAREVELRMAELLAEHGISGEKVILPEDVDFLKAQLGDPQDFSDDNDSELKTDSKTDSKTESKDTKEPAQKRLFRDTDNAIIGGVAAGIANYLNIDAVIIRIAFVLLTIFGGGTGIVIYLILWWIVPPANTASEKLQMRGLPVTLEALKESVTNADLAGKARRVNNAAFSVINAIFRGVLRLIGVGFIAAGTGLILAIVTAKTYMLAHGGQLFQENLFPVGFHEQLLVIFGMVLLAVIALFLILTGITTFKRKWPVHGWITAVLIALFLVGTAATAALTADAVPRLHERYQTMVHTTPIRDIQSFSTVETSGDIDLSYISSPDYAVNVHYVDHPDLSKLKIYVADNVLHVDSNQLDQTRHCTMLCLFPRYNMTVQIYAPNIENFKTPPDTDIFYPDMPAAPNKL